MLNEPIIFEEIAIFMIIIVIIIIIIIIIIITIMLRNDDDDEYDYYATTTTTRKTTTIICTIFTFYINLEFNLKLEDWTPGQNNYEELIWPGAHYMVVKYCKGS